MRLVKAVAHANPNTAVVLFSGSAVECPWADDVKAIVYMGLPGQAGGQAVADRLYGKVNPSGKLTESWPYRYEDVPSAHIYGKTADALYQEGLYVGYRYYDKSGVPVRWPFGYGLSYTKFQYTDLSADGDSLSVQVQNIGGTAGAEVVQLFVEAAAGWPAQAFAGAQGLLQGVFAAAGKQARGLSPGGKELCGLERRLEGAGRTLPALRRRLNRAPERQGEKLPAPPHGKPPAGMSAVRER